MKQVCKEISKDLRLFFGYGVLISLFVGGLTFFGYVAALIIGGDTAAAICTYIWEQILPPVIELSTTCVLLGLVVMYLNGEVALTASKKKASKHEGEV